MIIEYLNILLALVVNAVLAGLIALVAVGIGYIVLHFIRNYKEATK